MVYPTPPQPFTNRQLNNTIGCGLIDNICGSMSVALVGVQMQFRLLMNHFTGCMVFLVLRSCIIIDITPRIAEGLNCLYVAYSQRMLTLLK